MLRVHVRGACKHDDAKGHLAIVEEKVIYHELPTVNRRLSHWDFQLTWDKRPEGLIPLLDNLFGFKTNVFPTVEASSTVYVQPMVCHPRGNQMVESFRWCQGPGKLPLTLGGSTVREGVVALIVKTELMSAAAEFFEGMSKEDVDAAWGAMLPATVHQVMEFCLFMSGGSMQHVAEQNRLELMRRFVAFFVEENPTSSWRRRLGAPMDSMPGFMGASVPHVEPFMGRYPVVGGLGGVRCEIPPPVQGEDRRRSSSSHVGDDGGDPLSSCGE